MALVLDTSLSGPLSLVTDKPFLKVLCLIGYGLLAMAYWLWLIGYGLSAMLSWLIAYWLCLIGYAFLAMAYWL